MVLATISGIFKLNQSKKQTLKNKQPWKTRINFLKDKTQVLDVQNHGNITVAQINYCTTKLDSIISLHEAFEKEHDYCQRVGGW